ncbi:MAG: hypothetical protein HYY85_19755 [Deltaproteobacteria bacterium]|nr:hypothetical protein [Deltaproteobacteria bacterium]
MLADMATRVEASRALVARAAQALEAGSEEGGRLSAMAKLHATDAALRVAADAMQVLGGAACFQGSPAERALRDVKISQIYEGTNQIQRLVIARSLLGPDLV